MRIYEYGYSIRTLGLLARATIKKWPIQKPRQLATAAPLHAERYDITCGISGKITVELYNSFLLRNSPSTPLVIYLPPCPTSPLLPLNPPSWLLSSYPILNIPYRWSHNPSISYRNANSHPFPIPLHDTLHAYSWLLDSYLPSLSSKPRPLDPSKFQRPQKPIQRPLLIYGSYLGGTLATSLALTESLISSLLPTKIHSLIVHNGIFDWTPISTKPGPSKFSNSSSQFPSLFGLSTAQLYTRTPWTSLTLHTLKTRLFPSPSQTFDPFASPILFFRRPGIETPKRWPIPTPSLSVSSMTPMSFNKDFPPPESETDEFSPCPSSSSDGSWDTTSIPPKEEPHEPLENSQKSNLIFPPPKTSLQIPRSLFTYSSPQHKLEHTNEYDNADIFKHQARELTNLMRRSIAMHELKHREFWDEGCDKKEIARERVRLVEVGDGGKDSRVAGDRNEGGTWEEESESEARSWMEQHQDEGAEREEIVRSWIEEGGL